MNREQTEIQILDLLQKIVRLAAEYGSTGTLGLSFVPYEEGGGICWVNNEYWSAAPELEPGRDVNHPLNATRFLPRIPPTKG